MASSWTPERRARQAALIRTWKPRQQSTGPRTPSGKARASRNAFKGGHWQVLRDLSRTVNAEVLEARDLIERVTRRIPPSRIANLESPTAVVEAWSDLPPSCHTSLK